MTDVDAGQLAEIVRRDALIEACAKCGWTDMGTAFHPSILACPWLNRDLRRGRDDEFSGEHLHRTCRRCGWEWAEPPLDTLALERTPDER